MSKEEEIVEKIKDLIEDSIKTGLDINSYRDDIKKILINYIKEK